jgi:hypothetical protein
MPFSPFAISRNVKQKRFQSSKQVMMWLLFLALSQISKLGIDGFQLLSHPTPADRHVQIGGANAGAAYHRGGTLAILSAPPIRIRPIIHSVEPGET